MLKFTFALALSLNSVMAFAQTSGNTGIVPPWILERIAAHTQCSSDVDGVAVDTAAGTLTLGDRVFSIDCELQAKSEIIHPDQGHEIWSCVEARAGEGRYHVSIGTLGIIPAEVAYVSIEQMFPLKPQHLYTLGCAN